VDAPTLPPAGPVGRTATFPGPPPAGADAATLPPALAGSLPAAGAVAVPGYELLGELGRGGMGVVYRARQVGLNRLVALKMILAGGHASASDHDRFRTEAEAVARLLHPNIVQVYETGTHAGLPYFSLEFCPGGSLDRRLDGTPWDPAKAAVLVETLARAMHAAHTAGVVHRDLKPANVLLAADGTPKVTDFGLAKRLDSGAGQTASGAILGTPSYMAPEQAGGATKAIGPAADVYALGAILYELLTGRPPFRAATPLDTVLQVVSEEPVPPARLNPKTPCDLETVCLKCLAKEPAKRYATAEALAEDLRRFQAGEPIAARPVGRLERGWRWCRRNPALAGSLAAAALALVAGTVASTLFGVRANRNAEQAREEKRTAQHHLYAARMNLAQMAWEANNVGRVLDLLDATKPSSGEEDLRGFEWHYWDRMCHDLLTLKGHKGPVSGIAFSPDGRNLASGGDTAVNVWDATTGQKVLTLDRRCLVGSVAYSPDGRRLASGGEDQAVKVWDAATGQELLTLKGSDGAVRSLAYSPDGRKLASTCNWDSVTVWDADTGHVLQNLRGRNERWFYTSVAFSPDGRRLAGGDANGRVKVWDVATGALVCTLQGHMGVVRSLTISPDGRLASGGQDGVVRVWDAATGQELMTLKGHAGEVMSVAYSPDGRRLASGGVDTAVKVWDAATGQELMTLKGNTDKVMCVAYSAGGQWLTSGCWSGEVKVWDAATGQEVMTLKGDAKGIGIRGIAYCPDGTCLASAEANGSVKVWDAAAGQQLRVLGQGGGAATSVAFSPDGRQLASGGLWGAVKVWDAATGQELLTLKGSDRVVTSLAYSPDGRRLACVSDAIKVWDAATGQELTTLKGSTDVTSVAYSPDGRRLVGGGWDGGVRVWDAATGQELVTLKGHVDVVHSVAYGPGGRHLASGGKDGVVRVWDAATGQELLALKGHAGEVMSVAYSPDGRRLAAGNEVGLVRVWDAATGQELLTLKGYAAPVNSVAFSPNGRRLASARDDGTIIIWGAFEHERRAAAGAKK
jgi:WD40 repeat protein